MFLKTQRIVKTVIYASTIEIITVDICYMIIKLGFWIGKCVGAANLVHFSNFCLSTVLYFFYMIITRIPIVFRLIENAYK